MRSRRSRGPWAHNVERENSSVESILSLAELCRFTTDFRYFEEEEKGRKVEQETEREDQSEENARMTMHMEMT